MPEPCRCVTTRSLTSSWVSRSLPWLTAAVPGPRAGGAAPGDDGDPWIGVDRASGEDPTSGGDPRSYGDPRNDGDRRSDCSRRRARRGRSSRSRLVRHRPARSRGPGRGQSSAVLTRAVAGLVLVRARRRGGSRSCRWGLSRFQDVAAERNDQVARQPDRGRNRPRPRRTKRPRRPKIEVARRQRWDILLNGLRMRICSDPKSTSTAISSSTRVTRPRPYVSWTTRSPRANRSHRGVTGALKGLVGKWRLGAAGLVIGSSMRLPSLSGGS